MVEEESEDSKGEFIRNEGGEDVKDVGRKGELAGRQNEAKG